MIERYFEFTCDFCGNANHYQGTKEESRKQARNHGGIVNGDEFFCDKDCLERTK